MIWWLEHLEMTGKERDMAGYYDAPHQREGLISLEEAEQFPSMQSAVAGILLISGNPAWLQSCCSFVQYGDELRAIILEGCASA